MFADAYSQSALKRENDRAVKLHIEQDTAAAACLPGKRVQLPGSRPECSGHVLGCKQYLSGSLEFVTDWGSVERGR